MSEAQVSTEVEEEKVFAFDMPAFIERLEGNNEPAMIDLELISGIEVYKVTTSQLVNIVDLIKHSLKTLGIDSFDAAKLQTFANEMANNPDSMFDTFLQNFERGKKCVVGLCSLTEEQVDSLVVSDLVVLVACQWKVNESFFMKRINKIASLIPVKDTEQ